MELTLQYLRKLVKVIPGDNIVYQVSDKLKMLAFSRDTTGQADLTQEEYIRFIGDDALHTVLEQDREYVQRILAQCVTTGRAEGSYRIRHQAKGAIWVRVIGRRLGEWEGLPVIVVNFLNTTKEIEVHDSLLDNSGNIVYICDAKTQELLYANKIALETWGKVDYLGHRCYEFIKGKSEPCHWCPMIQGKALPSE